MDHMGSPPLHPADHPANSTKRKRSPSNEPSTQPTPPAKISKTHSHHLHINYLARQFPEILPLISAEHDNIPSLLSLIGDYEGVLQRHESMAGNLGARPLGPILIQRFERLFDGPPRVLKINGKESTSVGWLDVVEFARNKPEQFKLEQTREGVKVCQFYTKQCRVEISEEDFVLIKSGMPQKLIPPQPIEEDEEKELGTLEILEKALGVCVHLADQVAGRARQLNHKLKARKNAIISRREAEVTTTDEAARSFAPTHPSHSRNASTGDRASNSPTGGGFVAVNRHPLSNDRSQHNGSAHEQPRSNGPVTNGNTHLHGASAATRAELLSKFQTSGDRSGVEEQPRRLNSISRASVSTSKPNSKPYADSMEYAGVLLNTASPVPIPNTPSSLLPYVKPSPADRFDDSGPYKADMMARMEQLNRGDRVQPPCDRCRRLHMDCLKNLTACMGCTKKHAKCSWKDVEEQELKDHPFIPRIKTAEEMAAAELGSDGDGSKSGGSRSGREAARKERKRETLEVRDEELLGEETPDEEPETQELSNARQSPQVSSLRDVPTSMPPADPPAPQANDIARSANAMSMDAITNHDAAATRPATISQAVSPEPVKVPYQAPQAQMQTSVTATTNETTTVNGHVQTEYEKDIYSQLHEATRTNGTNQRRISPSPKPLEEPVRVYTAGSEPLDPGASSVPMERDPSPVKEDNVRETLPATQQQQPEHEQPPPQSYQPPQQEQKPGIEVNSYEGKEESQNATQDRVKTPKQPQMPSPPLSGVPSQSTPTPKTPVLDPGAAVQTVQI